jgi:cellulose synthase (UDP-forming)
MMVWFIVSLSVLLILYGVSYKNKAFAPLLGWFGVFLGGVYIVWRIVFTVPTHNVASLLMGGLLVVLEIIAFGQSVVFKLLFSSKKRIEINRSKPYEDLPHVDVIISTYNESESVLKRTIVACKHIHYPPDKCHIFIGDDGRRDSVRKLAQDLDVHYITRPDNQHAKAGNINNVLSQSQSDLILLLDADMIPSESILETMVPYFEDPQTGFVQAPQVFYNLDPFQYNLKMGTSIPNEQDFFMRTIEEKRSIYNAVLHVGTNALFSRKAIDAIGGIPVGTITEDMATGMLIQNAHYKSFFINDTLAIGLSVESIEDLVKQRDRWLRGNVQVIKKYNPFKLKGLNIIQKLIYMDGFVYWLFGVQKMVYILAPLLYLLGGIQAFDASAYDVAFMFLPYFISGSLYFRAISNNTRNITWSHIYDTAIAPHMAFSFISEFFFGRKIIFSVTPKGVLSDKDQFRVKLVRGHIILFFLSIGAIGLSAYQIVIGSQTLVLNALLINLVWCLYNLAGIGVAILIFTDKKRFRKSERIPTDLKAKVLFRTCPHHDSCDSCGSVVDISEDGARVHLKASCPHFDMVKDQVIVLDVDSVGQVQGKIQRISHESDHTSIGIEFDSLTYSSYAKINAYRFNLSNTYISQTPINKDSDSFLEIFMKATNFSEMLRRVKTK